jgi:RNA polymerase-binding protein DksA
MKTKHTTRHQSSREALLHKSAVLLQTVSGAEASAMIDYNDRPADELDLALEQQTAVASTHLSNGMKIQLERIKRALNRIEADTYGVCLDCESAISPKRLKAVPEAELCVDCQEAQEFTTRASHRLASA